MVRPLLPSPVIVAELGSGSGKKTRPVLQALSRHQHTAYYPIEISAAALAQCTNDLGKQSGVSVIGIESSYLEGLVQVAGRRQRSERLMLMFLGSSIGNFERPAADHFLSNVRRVLRPGDSLLLGTDLEQSPERLLLAYDDPLGVTASFNLNLLARINRELGGNFDLDAFSHVARFDENERRIEMHLMSRCEQDVSVPGAGCSVSFGEGETIWTESSYKYFSDEVLQMGRRAGFRTEAQWLDEEWPCAETLFIAD
jgi:dimethylhistidine N-methyltransferase